MPALFDPLTVTLVMIAPPRTAMPTSIEPVTSSPLTPEPAPPATEMAGVLCCVPVMVACEPCALASMTPAGMLKFPEYVCVASKTQVPGCAFDNASVSDCASPPPFATVPHCSPAGGSLFSFNELQDARRSAASGSAVINEDLRMAIWMLRIDGRGAS